MTPTHVLIAVLAFGTVIAPALTLIITSALARRRRELAMVRFLTGPDKEPTE